MKGGLVTILCTIISIQLVGQQRDVIQLNNGSFEEIPRKGSNTSIGIRGWYDCSELQFPAETSPDIHPVNAWNVTTLPSDGRTYLGMVIRDNDSWESVSQRLRQPLQKGKCYTFTIDLARSEQYNSHSRQTNKLENYTEPAVLRIWGGTGVCGHHELLAESSTISNAQWITYQFELRPSRDLNYFTLEAFYEVPVLIPYNGHLLLDNASKIIQIACPGEDPFEAVEIAVAPPKKTPTPSSPIKKPSIASPDTPAPKAVPQRDTIVTIAKTKHLQELNANTLRKGQTIRIEHLYFGANSAKIKEESYEVLDELFDFLKENRNIVVEIGGHTNTIPDEKDSQLLSNNRAKRVAIYLSKKGISPKRLRFKGYGRSQPIVKNDKYDMEARRKNQRVEIKILSLNYRDTGSITKPKDLRSVQKSG